MRRRPLLVGAFVALVGAALILFWIQRGADVVSEASGPTTTSSPTATPPVSPTSTSPTDTVTATEATGASPATAEPPPPPSTSLSTGSILRIPGIGLRAGLHAEGLRDGKINPPAGTVMWFTGYDRVAPGSVGTSVIAGHVVAGGRSDVFADLSRVRVGDRVELADTDGTTSTFRVVRAGVVDKDDLTRDQTVWGSNSSVRRLAIVTCDDAFGFRGDGHRVANYVVIAEPA
ncbi:MAG: class F sortase [Intrasporangiaceae bacterium]|nr:class F sortase [Intrasporangiaceae bacterium]